MISSGKVWKTSRGNGTSTVKWSLNAGREREKKKRKVIKQKFNTFCNAVEFDTFGKLYNLTPKTGLSKAIQRETDCV